jgi:addiction module HigA family antidote
MRRDFKPVHPGVILREIIEELGVSQARLAHDIGVSPMRISHIINSSRPVTGDVALRLGKYFGQSPQFWMNLQSNYDMQIAQEKIGKNLSRIQPCADGAV